MEKKIFYHDTDSGGVVYYANYLKYLEEARTEYLEQRGLEVKSFLAQGLLYAVRSCNVSYKSPARYGDTIACDARVEKTTGAQIFFCQRVWNKLTGQTLVEAEVVLVCLSHDFKPQPIPADMKERLQ
ncbi:MAG: YbgC/FadM family acyl-CoA thioesterase [Candidatus Omnitrophica bacterium]|nr:YbgC/FadM family acyl-CoA thioesterase [Candidatus Omnitrophota bacterium]